MGLSRRDIPDNPMDLAARWVTEATDRFGTEAGPAMALATTAADGSPDVRMVLCKDVAPEHGSIRFFTNLDSAKARQLAIHPAAAVTFWWGELSRQLRIRGSVQPVPTDEAGAYFASRTRASRVGAWASHQSQPVATRSAIDGRAAALSTSLPDDPELPDWWGGYELIATDVEFWTGRPDRLHDRFLCTRGAPATNWDVVRLQP